jgi:hypothetical protein
MFNTFSDSSSSSTIVEKEPVIPLTRQIIFQSNRVFLDG